MLLLLWTSFFISIAGDESEFISSEVESTAYIIYRIMIFPVHEIFFSKQVDNSNFLVILGYGINCLIQSSLIAYILHYIFSKDKSN